MLASLRLRSAVALFTVSFLLGCAANEPGADDVGWTTFQASLVPRLQAVDSGYDVRSARIGLLGAENRSLTGIDLVLGIGRSRGEVFGLQVAGVANRVDGRAGGIQASLVNLVGGDMDALQVGVLMNQCKENVNGIQLALLNTVVGDVDGLQLGGFMNSIEGNLDGIQVALINDAGGHTDGLQLGVWNNGHEGLDGLQLGVLNFAGEDGRGLQLGLLNRAEEYSGVQLGLLNWNDRGFLPVFPLFNFRWD